MSDFKPGDIVDITIKGVRVHEQDLHGCVSVVADAHDGDPASWRMPPQAAVERVAPAEWPPRPGDLWQEVDGALWFAQHLGGSQVAFVPARVRGSLDSALPAYVLETFGPLTLVHRKEGEQCGECESTGYNCGAHRAPASERRPADG